MKYFVAITDNKWFEFLARRKPDEVNFWRPSGPGTFKAIHIGAPFLFKEGLIYSPLVMCYEECSTERETR